MSTTCPGCGGAKTKRAELCGGCRRRANALGASVITHVAAPAAPVVPRTPKQNVAYHGKLRELALLEQPGAEGAALWSLERELKKWALAEASRIYGKPFASSTEFSELEMERVLEHLADAIDAGGRRALT